MEHLRVYEVAKELNLSSEALTHLLREQGFKVRGYMSVVTQEMLDKVKKRMDEDKQSIKKKDMRKERLHRRRKGKLEKTLKRPEEKKRAELKVKETLTKIKIGEQKPTKKKEKAEQVPSDEKKDERIIQLPELISVEELAKLLLISPLSLISKCVELGLMVTINQRLDYETASMIASEYDYDTKLISYYEEVAEDEEAKIERAPVVTLMGHVDHGKTTLLDYVRKTNVVAGEKGGITQHIGASMVVHHNKKITFLDTPGHEAFTAMRARGAQVTDIILIVVAADDGVMPQTVEAIDHARDAKVPIIVAINKTDLENAHPDKIKQQLIQHKLMLEEMGGDIPTILVSAKKGDGVDELLDSILLIAEMEELKAQEKGRAKGYVIEAKLDRYKGTVATILITGGRLKKGDSFVVGTTYGKVRAIYDEFDDIVEEAQPSEPVMVLGFEDIPRAGDRFVVIEEDRQAREIARKRKLAKKEMTYRPTAVRTLQSIQDQIQSGEAKELKVIIKGDVSGSVEAISDSFRELSTEDTKILVVHSGVGEITESDVLLANVSGSIIVGYHIGAPSNVKVLAKSEGVELRMYDVIYKALEDIKLALTGLLEPVFEEKLIGEAEIREVFTIPRIGKIAGCYVKDGVVVKNATVKILRDTEVIGEGKIISLRRIKDVVNEVTAGFECGIGLEDIDEFYKGDMIQVYEVIEKNREI